MKQFIVFLVATIAMIIGLDLYFEYCISRPFPELWIYVLGIVATVAIFLYLRLTAKLLIKFLKL